MFNNTIRTFREENKHWKEKKRKFEQAIPSITSASNFKVKSRNRDRSNTTLALVLPLLINLKGKVMDDPQ